MDLITLDGTPLSLDAFRGKPLLVNLWASWCGPCLSEMPSLERVRQRFADSGLVIVAISDEPLETIRPFVAKHGQEWRFLLAKRVLRQGEEETKSLPQTYVFTAAGRKVLSRNRSEEWDTPALLAQLQNLRDD